MGIPTLRRRAVFLDRDGVLNQAIVVDGKPYSPHTLDAVIILKDAHSALSILKQAHFLLIGATNQPDVTRGTTTRAMVESINKILLDALPLDEIRVCYHDDADQCDCRKPLPGLLLQAAYEYDIDLKNSFMIGDRWKDVAAGKSAGCQTIWLNYHYQEAFLAKPPDFTTASLLEAATWIVRS
ncbi:MAG: D,D-heptose 1,7-bisphosphate phosphatase [Gammaproteobacteria bacterium RIFCSPHIGHO2_12_FULL_37_34]|nr:MAG: D,D-heptose 1,7-bisphosphate phosphatase [Gammaproteobacteria bacterium RIFCSPHIGHO2_12_FULL_37_34]